MSAEWSSTLQSKQPPDFLVIGHATRDVEDGFFRLGGTVTYAGLLGVRLGLQTAVVTSHGPDLPVPEALKGASVSVRPSPASTTFRNRYDGSHRQQLISEVASPLALEDVPDSWRRSRVVLLGPVAGELQPDLFTGFPDALLGLTPQGLMRAWNEAGEVRATLWEPPDELLSRLDVLVLSEDDLPDAAVLSHYTRRVPVVAVTHAERGATVYTADGARDYPAYACAPVDPTGAGDVFAAAFLIELEASGDTAHAATFANSAASFVIEAEGPSGVPDRHSIMQRISIGAYRTVS